MSARARSIAALSAYRTPYFYDKYKLLSGDDLANYDLIERLEKLDAIGLIHWPKKEGGMPQGKRLLEDALGIPLQDV
jgi:tRNA A37 threonylcarbamoyladenosine biosynthesis protein TsaE